MAGNLVKWWKHKILGGYKQFSVQECTTDSEELMYHQVRASSSCSAPPDLLLVSDRENNMPLRSPVVNIIAATTATAPATTTTSPSSSAINACHITSAANNNQHRYQQQQQQQQQKLQHHHHHQQQQQQQHHQHQVTTQQLSLAYNNGCKDIIGNTGGGINAAGGSGGGGGKHQKQSVIVGNSSSTSKHGQHQQQQQQTPDMQPPPSSVTHDVVDGQPSLEAQTNNHSSSTKQTHHHAQQQHHNHNTHHQQAQRSEEHIRLEEFTCDVSVEGGKSTQPLQFSFTFYDLDGHHGKITKDDIVGIVYTIYESIGKSVVVPHSGSKTINVRLTVSPEGKTATKASAKSNKKALVDHHHSLNLNQKPSAATAALASSNNTQATTRRLHRYRPRKLIKSDEEDDDSNSDKERDLNLSHILAHKAAATAAAASKAHKLGKHVKTTTAEQHCCSQQQQHHQQQQSALNDLPNSPLDTTATVIYDNIKPSSPLEACRECLAAAATADEPRNAAATSPLVTAATTTATANTTSPAQFPAASSKIITNEAYMKHVASTRIKMLRKSRKQKHQDCLETRQRSLSVGNETCWKNRHLQAKHSNNTQQQLLWQHLNNSVAAGGGNGNGNASDMVDGVQLRNPLKNAAKSMMASASASSSAAAAHKRNSAECWKTALNRNDLISIIRESMEKNRLCFQLNGKPQANVSPIRQQTNNPHQQTQLPHNSHVASSSKQTPVTGSQHQQHQQQRQRSNTVSKIPTLIANHNNTQSAAAALSISPQHHHPQQRSSSCANTIISNNCNKHSHSHDTSLTANELYSQHTNSSNSSNNHHYHHHQPHIPIYHQQMAINPAVIAAQNALLTATASGGGNVGSSLLQQHGKMNLCGYDSFLHATICGGGGGSGGLGGLSHSPTPPSASALLPARTSSLNTQITNSSNIATVQPIMSQNLASTSKHLSLAVLTPQQQQLKSAKILRQTSNSTPPSQSHQHPQHHHSYAANTTQNSPQYHGYQRLPSSSKHNLSALHLLSPNTEKPSLSELDKWRRDQVKSYDQLLYAKLSEKLQQTNLVASPNAANARDCHQRRKQRVTRQRNRAIALQQEQQAQDQAVLSNISCLREEPTAIFNTVLPIPIGGDPVECENLLGQTSDEDINSPQDEIKPPANDTRQVAEATLVDIDKITDELTAQKANLTLNVDTLLSVNDAEEHSLHAQDLEIDEDLEEDEAELDEELEEDLDQALESGRNSNNSNNSSNAANTTANTTNTAANNGANNSTNSTSSLIHRYVHEHIHHHYHHFEEKEE